MCYALVSMRKITQRELRNSSAAVLREVQDGATVLITRNGTTVAELRPAGSRRFVSRTFLLEALSKMPRIDAESFFADIDRDVDQSVG